jgi:hypothetical protein
VIRPRSELAPPVSHRRILVTGWLGVVKGALVAALSLFFLFVPWANPAEVGGVMVPLAVAIPLLALGIGTLLPQCRGATPETATLMAGVWIVIGVGAAVITVAGIIRSHSPWATFAVLPILIDAALFRSAFSVRRQARELRRSTSAP